MTDRFQQCEICGHQILRGPRNTFARIWLLRCNSAETIPKIKRQYSLDMNPSVAEGVCRLFSDVRPASISSFSPSLHLLTKIQVSSSSSSTSLIVSFTQKHESVRCVLTAWLFLESCPRLK